MKAENLRVCVLMGSPKANGNTAELCKPFIEELKRHRVEVEYIELYGKNIAPCKGCFHCQDVSGEYGCAQQDDMQSVVNSILKADVLVFATPIHTWQASTSMKAVMDRMFGINKFFGSAPYEILNEGQAYALIVTCGEEADFGVELLDEIFRRWNKHSQLPYLGNYTVRDEHGLASFQTAEAIAGAQDFARKIMQYG